MTILNMRMKAQYGSTCIFVDSGHLLFATRK